MVDTNHSCSYNPSYVKISNVQQLAMFVQQELSFERNDSKYFSMRLDLAPKISRRKKSQKEWQMRQMYVYFILNFLSLPFSLLNKKYLSQTKNIQKENVIKEVVTTYYIKYYYSNIIMLVVDKKFTYTTALDTYFRSLPILCQERMNFIFVFLKSP